MKTLLSIMFVLIFAVSSFAVKYDKKVLDAIPKDDYTAKLAYWKSVDAPKSIMNSKFWYVVFFSFKVNKLNKSDTLALVDKLGAEYGIAQDYINYRKVILLRVYLKDHKAALKLALANKDYWRMQRYLGHCYASVKQYDKAIEVFCARGQYSTAGYFSMRLGDSSKSYKLFLRALLKQKLTTERSLTAFNRFSSLDLYETDITAKQQLKNLYRIRKKYSQIGTDGKFVHATLLTQLEVMIKNLKDELQ